MRMRLDWLLHDTGAYTRDSHSEYDNQTQRESITEWLYTTPIQTAAARSKCWFRIWQQGPKRKHYWTAASYLPFRSRQRVPKKKHLATPAHPALSKGHALSAHAHAPWLTPAYSYSFQVCSHIRLQIHPFTLTPLHSLPYSCIHPQTRASKTITYMCIHDIF